MEQKLDSKALWSLNPSTFQSPKVRTVPTGLWLQFTSTRDPLRKRAMGGEDQSIECQVKPANNSLTCCYAISKERCEETWSRFVSFCDDLTWVPFLKIETWQRTWEKYVFKPNSTWFCAKMTQLFAHFFGNFTTFVTLLVQIPKSFQITLRAQKSPTWKSPTWTFLAASLALSSRTFFPSTSSQAFLWSLL